MSNKETVDRELREYLAQADNLRNEDKLNYLRALFDKHFTFRKIDHTVNYYDLFRIVSDAKGNMSKQRVRPHISGRQVEQGDLTSLAVIDAFIGYLNSNGLLNKNVQFDYTDERDPYEVID